MIIFTEFNMLVPKNINVSLGDVTMCNEKWNGFQNINES